MPNPLCFSDSTWYPSSEHQSLVSFLISYPEICQVESYCFQFKIVGVICIGEQPVIVFPKNYNCDLTGKSAVSESKILTKALLRYRSEYGHPEDELQFLYGNTSMSSGRIAAAMYLLEDYCRNGFITRYKETTSVKNSGRTDWNATINKTQPVFSMGSPVYCTPVRKRSLPDNTNPVCLTHKYIINECFKEWGWFFGYDEYHFENTKLPYSISDTIRLLHQELRKTYLDREILVIKNMIQYLDEKSGRDNNKKIDVIATPYFSFVWESICGYLLDNQYPKLKTLLPQPEWESNIVKGQISQRPDIFSVKSNSLIVYDAKYYDCNSNLPGWHDVVKQLFYRHTLNSVIHTREFQSKLPMTNVIYNAFLFPGNNKSITCIGRVTVPKVPDLGDIKAFVIDQKRALSAYAYRNDPLFLNQLREELYSYFVK